MRQMQPGKDFIGVGCGALIIDETGKVLLMKRSQDKSGAGLWARPGGKVEKGEKLEDAVIREIKEEIGVDIEIEAFLDWSEVIENGCHWVNFGFLARIVRGEVQNKEPNKCDELRWFNFSELPENIAYYTQTGIDAYKKMKKEKNG